MKKTILKIVKLGATILALSTGDCFSQTDEVFETYGTLTFNSQNYEGKTETLEVDHQGNINISANNFTLDCDSWSIFAPKKRFIYSIISISGTNVTVKNCRIRGYAIHAISIAGDSANLSYNKIEAIYIDRAGIKIAGNKHLIFNNHIYDASYAIRINSDNSTIMSNSLFYNDIGIYAEFSKDLKIKSNAIYLSKTGISCVRCNSSESSPGVDYFLISENEILFNTTGIRLGANSKNVSVWTNIITDSYKSGVQISASSKLKIWSNIVAANDEYGVEIVKNRFPNSSINIDNINIDNNVFFSNEVENVSGLENGYNNIEINSHSRCIDKSVIGHKGRQYKCQ